MTPEEEQSLYDALLPVESPEVALRTIYQRHDDRKQALASGARNAMYRRGKLQRLGAFLTPWPTKLEAITEWETFSSSYKVDWIRASALGFFIAIPITSIAFYLHGIDVADVFNKYKYYAVVGAISVVLGAINGTIFQFGMHYRFKHFDEAEVLEYVVARLNAAVAKDARNAPYFMRHLRSRFEPRGMTGGIYQDLVLTPRIDKHHEWTATLESKDPVRNTWTYRVYLFEDKRPHGELFAEIALEPDGKPPQYKELIARVHAIAVTGKSNVPTLAAQI